MGGWLAYSAFLLSLAGCYYTGPDVDDQRHCVGAGLPSEALYAVSDADSCPGIAHLHDAARLLDLLSQDPELLDGTYRGFHLRLSVRVT